MAINENEAFKLAQLIHKYIKGDLNDDEKRRLLIWAESDLKVVKILEAYRDGQADERVEQMNDLDLDGAWEKIGIKQQQRKAKRKIVAIRWMKYAAAVIIVGSLIFHLWPGEKKNERIVPDNRYGYKNDVLAGFDQAVLILSDGKTITLGLDSLQTREQDGTDVSAAHGTLTYMGGSNGRPDLSLYNTINVPKSGIYALQLSDGSKVWLNTKSSLRFPLHFSESDRTVYLEGEAYFEVKADPHRPFNVIVGDKSICALGTSFNVDAYDKQVAATLMSGSVKLVNPIDQVLLKPGQVGMMDGNQFDVREADIKKASAWRNGYFHFHYDTIHEVMTQLARWYGIDVVYKGNVGATTLGGSIKRSSSLAEVLQLLQDVSELRFEIQDTKLIIEENK